MSKQVFLGISGGVDSAVCALILKSQGYSVIGVHLVVSEESKDSDAKKVCDFLEIPYVEIDVKSDFKKAVSDKFIESYRAAETPSPCLLCNAAIKFKTLFSLCKTEQDFIATGHYAIKHDAYGKAYLKWEKTQIKDQNYMLYRVESDVLKKTLFPIAGLEKKRVREIAEAHKLFVSEKKDSQDLCFAKRGYVDFLDRHISDKKCGNIVTQTGLVVGKHQGYEQYTIGQRRGLNINLGEPSFVVHVNLEQNEVVVGPYSELAVKKVRLREGVSRVDMSQLNLKPLIARPRSSSKGHLGYFSIEDNAWFFTYDDLNYENSLGQHMVLYDHDFIQIAGGIIDELYKESM